MSGLTAAGFTAKSLDQIKTDLENELRDAFGDINTSPGSVFSQLIGIEAEARALLWQEAEAVYQSQYPSSASGVGLDRAAGLNNVRRLLASPTLVTAEVFGDTGTVIPAGSEASNDATGDIYELTAEVTLSVTNATSVAVAVGTAADSTTYTVTVGATNISYTSGIGESAQDILSGLQAAVPGAFSSTLESGELRIVFDDEYTVSVTAELSIAGVGNNSSWEAQQTGQRPLPVGALTEIETPVSGWAEITNRQAGITGRDRETDAELRFRREQSIRISARGPFDAILAALQQVEGVVDANLVQNNGSSVDADGVPPQHVWAIVEGGADADIAQALFNTVSAGIGYYGSETLQVESDVSGQTFDVSFDRPTDIDVWIEIDLTSDEDWPADGVERIKQALVGFGADLGIGEALLYSRLYSPINSVPGHYVTDLQVGTSSPASGMTNIEPARNERIAISADRIVINVA